MITQSKPIDAVLDRLHSAAERLGREVKLMEVCGTHTMSAFRSGLHALIPENVKLLSGPGCPVCVTSQGDIDQMLAVAGRVRGSRFARTVT